MQLILTMQPYRLYKWLVTLIVGPNGEGSASKNYDLDGQHRQNSEKNGIFADIWQDAPVYLKEELANILRGATANVQLCECTSEQF